MWKLSQGQRLCAIAMLDSLDSFHAKQIEELEGVALKQVCSSHELCADTALCAVESKRMVNRIQNMIAF
jgi:hypothetical protein